jgi:hypothetical protein
MIDYKKLREIANQKYPMMSGGYFDGEIIDGNEDARHAYVQGFEDGMRYAMENVKEGKDNV